MKIRPRKEEEFQIKDEIKNHRDYDDVKNTPHSTPVVETSDYSDHEEPAADKEVDPTRYGDWEKKGRCIDF